MALRTPIELRLLRLLQRYPDCIRQVDIVLTTDLTPHEVTVALRALKLDGLAAKTSREHQFAAWGTTENVAAEKAKRVAAQKNRAKSEGRLSVAEKAAKKAAEEAEIKWFSLQPKKRIVRNGRWVKPAVAAPFSVFTQAQGKAA